MPIALIPDDDESMCGSSRGGSAFSPFGSAAASGLSLGQQREAEGRCASCGIQTYQLTCDASGYQHKLPLSIDGEVYRGRCLLCYPLEDQRQSAAIPVEGMDMMMTPDATEAEETAISLALESALPSAPIAVLTDFAYDAFDVLMIMKMHPGDVYIQSKGCERLWILSWDEDTAASIGRVGGISILLDAMANFPQDSFLQLCGCEALQNLACVPDNRHEICDLGGVALIVRAMTEHSDLKALQQCGCNAISNISRSVCLKNEILSSGGYHVILRNALSQDYCVMRAAKDALRSLGYRRTRELPRCPTPELE